MVHVMPAAGRGVAALGAIAAWTAPDGRGIAVRPLDGTALERFGAFVRGLSVASRARRFLAPVNELGEAAARRLVLVDQRSTVAWIAEECAAPGAIVAEVRYAITAPAEAELALAVADEWQQSGLGSHLLRKLLGHASAAGIRHVWGSVRRDNGVAITLARRLGFDVRPDPDERALLTVARTLVDAVVAGAAPRAPVARLDDAAWPVPSGEFEAMPPAPLLARPSRAQPPGQTMRGAGAGGLRIAAARPTGADPTGGP